MISLQKCCNVVKISTTHYIACSCWYHESTLLKSVRLFSASIQGSRYKFFMLFCREIHFFVNQSINLSEAITSGRNFSVIYYKFIRIELVGLLHPYNTLLYILLHFILMLLCYIFKGINVNS